MSAVFPVGNLELYLLGAAAVAPSEMPVALVLVATVGQIAGRRRSTLPPAAPCGAAACLRGALDGMQATLRDRRGWGTPWCSAGAAAGCRRSSSLPRWRGRRGWALPGFILFGSLGRLVRCRQVALPHLAKDLL
ncbi:MAG: hypothetical protein KY467_01395 [Gemmatimonadetes bacterium]|nr:hypothetical protein [Gemmatimonadota bacterium]